MIKTIPFDVEAAKKGAKVCLEDGKPVTIVNFESTALHGWPIIGRYKNYAGEDVYEVWPESGAFHDLDTLGRNGPPPPPLALVAPEVSEVEYEGPPEELIEDLKAKIRDLEARLGELEIINDRLRLEREKSLADIKRLEEKNADQDRRRKDLADENYKLKQRAEAWDIANKARKDHYKELEEELAIYRDQTKAPISVATMIDLQRQIAKLEQWKKEQIAVFGPVIDYTQDNPGNLTIGDSIGAEVLRRVQKFEELERFKYEVIDNLKKWRAVKDAFNKIAKSENV